jgi:hypothetical protein
MTSDNPSQFVIRFNDAAGVANLYVTTIVAKYPTSQTAPAAASAAVKATIAKIEAVLGGNSVAMISASGTTPEGQMIDGKMIEGQMIEGQMIEGQMIGNNHID